MKVFIGGVMQGQRQDDQIDSQAYRTRITAAFQKQAPEIGVIDPWALNPASNMQLTNLPLPTKITGIYPACPSSSTDRAPDF